MNANTFLKKVGWKEAQRVAELAGTSRGYFAHIAHGRKRPSIELADRLVEASDGKMTFDALIRNPLRTTQTPRLKRKTASNNQLEKSA